jgi:hypothetical protein
VSRHPASLRRDVHRWWQREGRKLDTVDVAAVCRQPWALGVPQGKVAAELYRILGRILEDGACPALECPGRDADPTSARSDQRPCSDCYDRHWLAAPAWRGPRVVLFGLECCPACGREMGGLDECAGCEHSPRGASLETALRMSAARGANDAAPE